MTEDQRLHLQFIQGNITRMNSNSTSMKEWMVAIVSALLAIYASSNVAAFIWVAIAPVVIFWVFDTYYLWIERKYRILYDKVVKGDQSIGLYSMDASRETVSFSKTLFRPVEGGIYLPIIGLLILAGLFI